MKILVDENMPYARELFSRLGNVKAVPGRPIPVNELDDADALMVRSVTKVNEALLAGKAIKFVGTATAGTDHVDDKWLKQAGIGFSAAPGCNAIAVVEYVFSSLLMLAERDGFALKDRTVGIVGVGNVGGRLQKRLEALGIRTLLCDPPRKDNGDDGDFRSLDELVEQCDVLTFHTPLFKEGPYKSLHLADEALIRRLKAGTILINACRGPSGSRSRTSTLSCLTRWTWAPRISQVIPSKGKPAVRRRSSKPTAPLSAIRSRWRWIPYSPRLNLAALPFTARSIRQR